MEFEHVYEHNGCDRNSLAYSTTIDTYSFEVGKRESILRGKDIIWFDAIIVDDIDDVKMIEIYVGGMLFWQIDVDFLVKLGVVEDRSENGNESESKNGNEKVRINLPKKLFMVDQCIWEIVSDDLIGIPMIGLGFHEIQFQVVGKACTKYELKISSVKINSRWQQYLWNEGHTFRILGVDKICVPHFVDEKSLHVVRVPAKILREGVGFGNVIGYAKEWEFGKMKLMLCEKLFESTMLCTALIDIVVNYAIERCEERRVLKFEFEEEDKKDENVYFIYTNEFKMYCGMGGLARSM